MEAIIISGMPAAGKTTVSRILSKKLGLPAMGVGDILKHMATLRGYHPGGDDWWDTQDGMKFLKERESNPDFDKEADRKLLEFIEKGDMIITSYTAPWISKKGFEVTAATEKDRAERMSVRDHSQINDALKATQVRDKENFKLYKGLYNYELGKDLTPFNLVVQTDNIDAEQVADVIYQKIKELKL